MGRSDDLDVASYGTDKLDSGYLTHYDREFAHLVDGPSTVLEIGVLRGASLRLWSDYFPLGRVVGVDVNPLDDSYVMPARTFFVRGNQTDIRFLDGLRAEHAPDGFDIIIDDASHLGHESRITFEHLFENHLRPGGIYLFEDWQTGYWPSWVDGSRPARHGTAAAEAIRARAYRTARGRRIARRLPHFSHQRGMVGVLKQIIDMLGDREHAYLQFSSASIERIVLTPGLAFIIKARVPGTSSPHSSID